MEDLRCPNGCGLLEKMMTPLGMMWECPSCKGRSMGIAVLKKSAAPKVVNTLWGMARDGHATRGVPCLHCTQSSARVAVNLRELSARVKPGYLDEPEESDVHIAEPGAEPILSLDLCQRCYVLWVETSQLANMPLSHRAEAVEEKELPDEAKKMLAIHLANQAARRTADGLNAHDGRVSSMWGHSEAAAADGILSAVFFGLEFF